MSSEWFFSHRERLGGLERFLELVGVLIRIHRGSFGVCVKNEVLRVIPPRLACLHARESWGICWV